ncbi:MAG: hypothetical protein PHT77_05585 [Bacteroidales bacterium]|nr:hypothetical protein [Bacteroidales bacterium]
MKRFLIVALLCLMVLPVMGSVSPIKTDFQDYTAISGPATEGDWYFPSSLTTVTSPDTYGHIYSKISCDATDNTYIQSTSGIQFIYAAFTVKKLGGVNPPKIKITLYNSVGSVLGTYGYYEGVTTTGTRMEVVVSGGTVYVYADDVLYTSGAVTVNPSYIRINDLGNTNSHVVSVDDIILGYADDSTIIGSIPPDWFIREDSTAPANRGLYQLNTTDPTGIPTLKNSNYFGLSYGRSAPDATTLTITNPSGTAVKSYPVANMSCECVIPITALSVGGAPIQNGKWSVSLADSSTTSYFWVTTSGAYVAWSADEYGMGDPATVTWDVTNDAWNVASPGEHYFFHLKIIDIYGTEKYNGLITTQTGSYSFNWSSSTYDTGVYYAEITRTNSLAPITTSILNWDETELTGYVKFQGKVYDAESTAELGTALVSMAQLGTDNTYTTAANGTYVIGGFLTGSEIVVNVTKSGYTRYNYSFTPLQAKTIDLDFALVPTTPTFSGVAIGGVARDTTYGGLIPNASVYVWNASESYVKVANPRGYYICDNGHSCSLSYKLYNVQGNKTGYSVSDIYKVVTG